jgi:hypothetical protein
MTSVSSVMFSLVRLSQSDVLLRFNCEKRIASTKTRLIERLWFQPPYHTALKSLKLLTDHGPSLKDILEA